VEAIAIQRRIFALFHRRQLVAATTGRFIGITRGLFGGFHPVDIRWQDLKDARVDVGILSATITIQTDPHSGAAATYQFMGLRKEEAQIVYRVCQTEEQAWREKRRIRELEEMRAKSGGINIGSTGAAPAAAGAPGGTAASGDDVARLARAKTMLDQGLISDTEYETIRARIISGL
jgi:hypothetical protein